MKISIIVPVYNVEPYLHRCIDSILAQTFTDFELILVDDGSPDNCPAICDEYAEKDPRIVVIHKENGGVSSARNNGLSIATGQKIVFCDSDDELPQNALQLLYNSAQETNAQLVIGDFKDICINEEKNTISFTQSYTRKQQSINTDDKSLFEFWTKNNMLSSCGKMFDRELIALNNLSFNPDLVVMEDYAFVIDYVSKCTYISMIKEVVYNYYHTATPVMYRRSRRDFLFDILAVSQKLQEFLTINHADRSEEYQAATIYSTLRMSYDVLWSLESSSIHARKEKYKKIKKAIHAVEFQKMLRFHKNSFSSFDYFCLKHKWLGGLLVRNIILKGCKAIFKKN